MPRRSLKQAVGASRSDRLRRSDKRGARRLLKFAGEISVFGEMPRRAFGGKGIGETAPFHGAERPRRGEKIKAMIARVAGDYAGRPAAHFNYIGVRHGGSFQAAELFLKYI